MQEARPSKGRPEAPEFEKRNPEVEEGQNQGNIPLKLSPWFQKILKSNTETKQQYFLKLGPPFKITTNYQSFPRKVANGWNISDKEKNKRRYLLKIAVSFPHCIKTKVFCSKKNKRKINILQMEWLPASLYSLSMAIVSLKLLCLVLWIVP